MENAFRQTTQNRLQSSYLTLQVFFLPVFHTFYMQSSPRLFQVYEDRLSFFRSLFLIPLVSRGQTCLHIHTPTPVQDFPNSDSVRYSNREHFPYFLKSVRV